MSSQGVFTVWSGGGRKQHGKGHTESSLGNSPQSALHSTVGNQVDIIVFWDMDAPDQGKGLFIGVGLVRGQEISWVKKFSSLIVSREKKVSLELITNRNPLTFLLWTARPAMTKQKRDLNSRNYTPWLFSVKLYQIFPWFSSLLSSVVGLVVICIISIQHRLS